MTKKISVVNCPLGGERAYEELMAGLGDTSRFGEIVVTYCSTCRHKLSAVIGTDRPHSFKGTKASCRKKSESETRTN